MINFIRFFIAFLALTGLVACEPGPGGSGSTDRRVYQDPQKAQAAARREARKEYYRGSRAGSR